MAVRIVAQEKLNFIKMRLKEEQKENKPKYTSFDELTVQLDNHFTGLEQNMTDRIEKLNSNIRKRFPNLEKIKK
jgi:IS1 family transposase